MHSNAIVTADVSLTTSIYFFVATALIIRYAMGFKNSVNILSVKWYSIGQWLKRLLLLVQSKTRTKGENSVLNSIDN